ncbi:MAG: hypothetical protein MUD01_05940 [Chloroflexaceae bacterium]|jgi:hypothetical protein|nr:hypothetical protein [Chloroflexaceae bacterium]
MTEQYTQSNNPYERERDLLRRELDEAHSLNRNLLRQLKKAQEAATEAQRAHTKMVGTLTETMRENTALTIERDLWKNRAERIGYHFDEQHGASFDLPGLVGQISEEEANIIRKAMARLHHPDAGGDSERMKAWNAALDRIAKR